MSSHAAAVRGEWTRRISSNNSTPAADVHAALQYAGRRGTQRGRCNQRQQLRGVCVQQIMHGTCACSLPSVLLRLHASFVHINTVSASGGPKHMHIGPQHTAGQRARLPTKHSSIKAVARGSCSQQGCPCMHCPIRQAGRIVRKCSLKARHTHRDTHTPSARTQALQPPAWPAVSPTVLPPASKLPGTRHTRTVRQQAPCSVSGGYLLHRPSPHMPSCYQGTCVALSRAATASLLTNIYAGRQASRRAHNMHTYQQQERLVWGKCNSCSHLVAVCACSLIL
jgi:hypothetical protein